VACNITSAEGKQKNILIADDKPQIRRIIRGMLEAHPGWEVCAEAEDGIQAVGRAKQSKPDVIVLDLAMPEMNGFEAAREISSALPGTPILLNTLYASPQVEKEAEKIGVLGVISKAEQYRLIPAIEEAFAVKQLSS
jgi:DNA-binding NarL/FixJ family response regulator